MSRTLNFFDQLLAQGRHLQTLGLRHQATRLFSRLAGFRSMPPGISEEAQKRLGELRLEGGQFHKARRHLAAVLAQQPGNARSHFLMATAVAADDQAEPQRALEHLCQAVALEPDNADYWCEFGLTALELDKTEDGLQALRRAFKLAPDNAEVVAKVAEGLRLAGRLDEARTLLRTAQFRNPRDGRFTNLWKDFQFQVLHNEQEARRRQTQPAEERGPILLPFVRPAAGSPPRRSGRRHYRTDDASPPTGPHGPNFRRISNKKHA